jgi:DNA-binding LacI/PurR family transcriptional regulator
MSIYEVAKLAGVSHTLVSRVINHKPGVSPKRVKQIEAAMKQLNYTPKPPSRRPGPKAQDSTATKAMLDVYALIVPELKSGLYASLQSGFQQEASTEHRQVLTCCSDNDVNQQGNQVLQLMDKRIMGVAMVPVGTSTTPPQHIRQLQTAGIPVVLLHRGVEGVKAPTLALSYEQVAEQAVEAMVAHGHRHIAAVFPAPGPATQRYEQGLRQTLERVGLALAGKDVASVGNWTPDNPDHAAVERAVKQLLDRPERDRPTAIFVSFDAIAELVYLQAMSMGINVPNELSIVSFGGAWRNGAIAQQLTAVTIDEEQVGSKALDLLSEMSAGTRDLYDDQIHEITLSFYPGKTLAANGSASQG